MTSKTSLVVVMWLGLAALAQAGALEKKPEIVTNSIGMKFALIQLGEYAHVIATSFLGALLFLGAWGGPGPAWLGPLWFLLKAMAVFLLLTWIRWSFVRIRVDQILAISWKLLLPATLILLMVTAVVVAWPKGGPVV